jgi:leader peptidase (prepilin peptidase) / N-methyltransferase
MEISLAFLFGLLIGSFLNVCIYRWPRDLSVVRPRSHCPHCSRLVAWYDNVPLLSYVLLRGRCRHCGARISPRYPAVEALTGLTFAGAVFALGPTPEAGRLCLLGALLIVLVFADLEQRILPDEVTLGGAALGVILSAWIAVPDNTATAVLWLFGAFDVPQAGQSLIESLAGAIIPALFLWSGGVLYRIVRGREGLGLGDVKLIAMVGAFLGLRGALETLIIGSLAGSVIGLLYIKLARKDAATYELPFGSFLGAAALLVAFLNRPLWIG